MHCFRKTLAELIDLGGNDAVLEDLLVVVDVVDEQVQRVDALLEAALDRSPIRAAGDDPRDRGRTGRSARCRRVSP